MPQGDIACIIWNYFYRVPFYVGSFPHVTAFSLALKPVLYPSEPSTNSSLLFSVWLPCPGPGIGK